MGVSASGEWKGGWLDNLLSGGASIPYLSVKNIDVVVEDNAACQAVNKDTVADENSLGWADPACCIWGQDGFQVVVERVGRSLSRSMLSPPINPLSDGMPSPCFSMRPHAQVHRPVSPFECCASTAHPLKLWAP